MLMKKITITLILFCSLFCTDTVKVYIGDNQTTMGKIETEIIHNVFKLYNQSIEKKIIYKIINLHSFNALFQLLEATKKSEKDYLMAVNQITITNERMKIYDFSIPYTPAKVAFISLNKKSFDLSKYKNVGVIKNTLQFFELDKYKIPINKITFNTVNELNIALKEQSIDYALAENVHSWDFKDFHIAHILENQPGEGYGFLYLKDSKLKNELDKFISYYLNSIKFKRLLMNYYDNVIIDYYINALKH
jgi:hypothetical protein